MNEPDEAQAVKLLGEAISRLENAVADQAARHAAKEPSANDLKVARKHAALRAEVTQTLRDLDSLMEAQHG